MAKSAKSRKTSPIWNYFEVGEDTKFANCNICKEPVSRGGKTTKTFNTTNLVGHLKRHSEQHCEYEKAVAAAGDTEKDKGKKKPTPRQLTLQEANERVRIWDINDPRAQRIHRRVTEMICLDAQPFSIVEDSGFSQLVHELEPRYSLPSRKYITENILPKIYGEVKAAVLQELTDVSFFSFTTDAWSSDDGGASLLSLTTHWITDAFVRQSAVLHVLPLEESHTGEYLARKYLEMLSEWKINHDQVHLVLRDNAANMAKAMRDASLPSLGCFAHTLQLIVHDGVLSQRAVQDTLAICRKIVGHFKHSSTAYGRLHAIQNSLGLPQCRLQQDVSTRWNSSLYMLQTVASQKVALAAYATQYSICQLTTNQLDLVDKIIAALSPIEEVTKAVSADSVSVSCIIPFVRMLFKTMGKHHNDRGVRTMKCEMLKSLKTRYAAVEENEYLAIATTLDPRFKDKFFCGPSERAAARLLLESKISPEAAESSTPKEPSPKRPCTDLWESFTEILEAAGTGPTDFIAGVELDKYLSEPLLPFHTGNCYTWWEENKGRFPGLAKVAQRYLSAPPTSVPSERLFSGAGNVYYDKRNRLAPERAETLLFVKNNFKYIH